MLYEIFSSENLNTFSSYLMLTAGGVALLSSGIELYQNKKLERKITKGLKELNTELERILEEQVVSKNGIDKILNRK